MRGGCLPRGTERVVERAGWRSGVRLLRWGSDYLDGHVGIRFPVRSDLVEVGCRWSRDLERVRGFVLLFPDAR